KYTPDNGHVTVELNQHVRGISIEIANTGKGIPADRITEIFDRYRILDTFEVETKKGVSSRNGLGLAICHSMVNVLEGEIEVNSEVNGWTTFRVLLPPLQKGEEQLPIIAENTIPVIQEEPLTIDTCETDFDQTKPTLMIVEDDPSMLWFITEIFVDKYNAIPLQDSREVEEAIKANQPDLVISDVMMPELDGISLTRYIKGNKLLSHIPVILLSAKIDAEEQVKGLGIRS
ncbi:MAG: hybrid sensor histidine kinase/response regulator, partial [Tannerellaceae bacterium]|nr:hybrid sensor histidine kinase/response regulator [Tannerellaceae bacterium]